MNFDVIFLFDKKYKNIAKNPTIAWDNPNKGRIIKETIDIMK